jgi:hypothetical protein
MANLFRQACTVIMEKVGASRMAPSAPAPATQPDDKDITGAIERLWKLHTDGALTRDEFEAGKLKLLS